MICSRCKVKQAHLAVIDKDGYYDPESGLFCCDCLIADMREKLAELRKHKGKEMEN